MFIGFAEVLFFNVVIFILWCFYVFLSYRKNQKNIAEERREIERREIEVMKAYEESYIISDLMGRQIEIDPRVAMNGGYKDAKDDLFLWYFEVMENEEIKIYPKKLTYNQMLEECKKNDIYIIKPLYSLGYTYNNNREDFKNYN
ncbi:hypothetical protein N5399_000997 [Campylobacter coli]|nr:hypothetical protein [Campylobacter coli]EJV0574371.1 hypothetical protein [Campylobacter coli]